jgi:hypothetical protein
VKDRISKAIPNAFEVDKKILEHRLSKYAIGRNVSGRRQALRPHMSLPIQVWPGILSSDPSFTKFRIELADEASRLFPAFVDENGFGRVGSPISDFTRLATVAGVKPSHSHCPPSDRSSLLRETGIKTQFVKPIHKEVFTQLHKQIFYYRLKGASAKFNVKSSTFFPSYIGGEGSQNLKQRMFHFIGTNIKTILKLCKENKLVTLMNKYGVMFALHIVQRLQSDALVGEKPHRIGKPRYVGTREYALTGTGESRVLADKMEITEGVLGLKEAPSTRHRVAYAANGQLNALLSMIQAGCREFYFNTFGFTWHHTGPRQLFDALQKALIIVGLDMSNMDQWLPAHILELHAVLMGQYYGEGMYEFVRNTNGAAYFSPQPAIGEDPFWIGDFTEVGGLTNDIGLASGRADNPDLGKFYCTGVYLILLDDYLGDVFTFAGTIEESIVEFLRGNHPRAFLLDMGDDAVLGFKEGAEDVGRRVHADLVEADKSGKSLSPYAMIGPEVGVAFLGSVVLKDEAGNLVMPQANPVTWLVNRHCPEHGIDSPHRKYWATGLDAARTHYLSAGDIITQLEDLERRLWKKHLPDHPTPEQMIEKYSLIQQLPSGITYTGIDAEVLMDPSKLAYKYDTGDVSPEIANLFIRTIDGDRVEQYLKPIVRDDAYRGEVENG